jgi:hypothetical protein
VWFSEITCQDVNRRPDIEPVFGKTGDDRANFSGGDAGDLRRHHHHLLAFNLKDRHQPVDRCSGCIHPHQGHHNA